MEVGKININFDVFSNSPQHISVMDLSDWIYAEEKPSYIEIIVPGSSKPKTYSFKKFKINSFNSHNLGLSCLSANCQEEHFVDLPDGIYTITVKSGFENIDCKKYYLKTDRFELEYNKVLVKEGRTDSDDIFIKAMIKIRFLLDVAKSHASSGNFVESNRYLQEAKKILKKYVECKDCL